MPPFYTMDGCSFLYLENPKSHDIMSLRPEFKLRQNGGRRLCGFGVELQIHDNICFHEFFKDFMRDN